MNSSRLAIAGVATALVVGAVTAPSAAFALDSVTFSQPTICPGESVTLTINQIADGTQVTLPSGEYFEWKYVGATNGSALALSMTTGTLTWNDFASHAGSTYTITIYSGDPMGPGLPTLVWTSNLEILSACAGSSPEAEAEPEAEALPNTGTSSDQITALAASGVLLAAGGFVLARRARRVKAAR